VASLNPPAAAPAAAHADAEAAAARRDKREILFVLVHHPKLLQVLAAAVRAARPKGSLVSLVDVVGNRPPGLHAIILARLAARALGVRLWRTLGEGSRLTLGSPTGFRKAVSQPSDLPLQRLVLIPQPLGLPP
jgi:hypothetical protein